MVSYHMKRLKYSVSIKLFDRVKMADYYADLKIKYPLNKKRYLTETKYQGISFYVQWLFDLMFFILLLSLKLIFAGKHFYITSHIVEFAITGNFFLKN